MTRTTELGYPPFVALHDVSVRLGRRQALDGASLALPAGAVTVVVGPNGAGKTTLLRVLAGTLAATGGRVDWLNAAPAPRVALVGQTVALYPFLTVGENCLAAGRMVGLRGPALHGRAATAMVETLCRDVEHQVAASLSGGYARRAAIAAAAMGDATLVVLDEPTTGLDAAGVEAVVATVRALRAAGRTIVVATHDFAFADAVADHALFLRGGRLEASDAPRPLCRRLFSDAMHVEVTLADAPDAAGAGLLASLGARRRTAALYSLLDAVDAGGCPAVLAQLRDAGLAVRETRIRAPGMALLFERFCGEGDAP